MFYLFEKIMSILNGSVSSVFLIYIYEPALEVMKDQMNYHARIQNILSEGVQH